MNKDITRNPSGGITKALLSVVFCVLLLSATKAQPSLQSTDLHTGMSFNLYSLNNVSPANLSSTGANVTWDLSAATLGPVAATVDFLDMASTGYAAQYPTANFAMKFTQGGTVSYNFWTLTSSTWEEVAINVGTGGLQTFVNNRTDLVFPFTFNLADTDTYQKSGQSASTVSHIFDAYGNVTLSTGTLSNLVRDYSVDIGAGTTQAIWWNASPVYPVIEADNNGVLLWKPATANGIEQVDKKPGFQIYPNPAGNELHILSEQTVERIEVYDVTGKLQISDTYSVVDISGLSQGIYVIKAFNATGMDTRKFIKQ